MKVIWAWLLLQLAGVLFGIYSEIAPSDWKFYQLPPGMGLGLTLISGTMAIVLIELERQERQRSTEHTIFNDLMKRLSMCVAFHERDFYALWPEQVRRARDTVDVTHLAVLPPRTVGGLAEAKYFSDLRDIYKNSAAHIRRVERWTEDKKAWINSLKEAFADLPNVSLAVYKDPLISETPAALSVCRIDDQYAWLIAIAEHESTGKHRDIMLSGADVVDLIRRYFQERLWGRSVIVVDRGVIRAGWEERILK